LESALKLDSSN